MKLIFIIVISLLASFSSDAKSLKTPQTAIISNIKYVLEAYRNRHGNQLPKNWQELIDSGLLSGEMLDNARSYIDIENRYMFVDIKPIKFVNEYERIIIMAREPGGEGNFEEALDPEKRKGRWMIVETNDGSIESRHSPEVGLRFWFKEAGLNLADYTFDAPPMPKFTPPRRDLLSEGKALGGPQIPDEGNNRKTTDTRRRESKSESARSESVVEQTMFSRWGLLILGGILTVGIVISRFILKNKNKAI